jgi:hypothetical protein
MKKIIDTMVGLSILSMSIFIFIQLNRIPLINDRRLIIIQYPGIDLCRLNSRMP